MRLEPVGGRAVVAEGGATVVMVLRYRAARDSVADSGSVTATVRVVAVIPQKELRNNVGEVLRRAEAGEQITITVSGRPVAQLGPVRGREWVDTAELSDLWDLPADRHLAGDLERFAGALRDPWAD
jgi:prevent-host-death family protein